MGYIDDNELQRCLDGTSSEYYRYVRSVVEEKN